MSVFDIQDARDQLGPNATEAQVALYHEWLQTLAAFNGAFNTPVARRKQDDEYARDARERMIKLGDTIHAFLKAMQPKTDRTPLLERIEGGFRYGEESMTLMARDSAGKSKLGFELLHRSNVPPSKDET